MSANDTQRVRGKPYNLQTQIKFKRHHWTMNNVAKLENYWPPGDLERKRAPFVTRYNTQLHRKSRANLTPQIP